MNAQTATPLLVPAAPVLNARAVPTPTEQRRARRTAVAALTLGLLFELLFDGHAMGVSFPLFIGMGLFSMLWLAGVESRQKARANLWLMVPMGLFAGMVGVRDSPLLAAVNVATVAVLGLLLAYGFAEGQVSRFGLLEHAWVPLKAAGLALGNAPLAIGEAVQATSFRAGFTQLLKPVLRGLAIALPVLLLFTALLCSADPRFAALVEEVLRLGGIDISGAIEGGLVSLGAAFGVVGLLHYSQRVVRAQAAPSVPKLAPRGGVEGITIALSIDALFIAFAALQAVHLFEGDPSASGNGLTYSSYARGGFFELLAVSLMTLALLLALATFIRPATPALAGVFKASCSVMAALVLILLASASKRMTLYEDAYGYTELRVYSHVFMFALGAAMAWRAVTFWWKPERFAFGAFLCGLGFVAALNALNPDGFIARKTLERAAAGAQVDLWYLQRLSADATPALAEAVPSGLLTASQVRLQHAPHGNPQPWPSFNLARWQAQRSVRALPW